MSAQDSLFPFDKDSPLGRACNDPVAALALLAEAWARDEKNREPYLIAANSAIEHVATHGIVLLPDEANVGDVESVLGKPGAPSPHELYEQTGGGQAYRDAMLEHGYIRKLTPEEKAERDRLLPGEYEDE